MFRLHCILNTHIEKFVRGSGQEVDDGGGGSYFPHYGPAHCHHHRIKPFPSSYVVLFPGQTL